MKPLLDEIAEALITADCGDYKTKPMHLYRPLAQAAIDVVERRLLSDDFNKAVVSASHEEFKRLNSFRSVFSPEDRRRLECGAGIFAAWQAVKGA
jgi:hypothetical protein